VLQTNVEIDESQTCVLYVTVSTVDQTVTDVGKATTSVTVSVTDSSMLESQTSVVMAIVTVEYSTGGYQAVQ
jgi:hypothetical protein